MLSTQYRLRLASICKDIGAGVEVSLEDMIWAEKLLQKQIPQQEVCYRLQEELAQTRQTLF